MAAPIHVADMFDMLVLRNCINDNEVNAINFARPDFQYLQYNFWGYRDGVAIVERVYGRIYAYPCLWLPCGQEVDTPALEIYPSTLRLGTMTNRRTMIGGRGVR